MKKLIQLTVSMLVLLAGLNPAAAQGTKFTYQGHLNDGGVPANGSYDLKFSLFNLSFGGGVLAGPTTNSPVLVSNGLFTTAIDFGAGVFNGTTCWLQIATRTNGGGAFTDLTPRQELTPTPYAIYAEASPVADNSVTSAKIADGTIANADLGDDAVNSSKVLDGSLVGADLANNTVTSVQLADSIDLESARNPGVLNIYNTSIGAPAISLFGTGTGGYMYLYQNDGQVGISLDGDDAGGGLAKLYAADGSIGITLNGNSGGAGLISLLNTNGMARVLVDGAGSGSGGQVSIYAQDGSSTIQLYGDRGGAGLINVNNNISSPRVVIDGEGNGTGGQINLLNGTGGNGITLYGDSGGGGLEYLYTSDGSLGITLDGDSGGGGYPATIYSIAAIQELDRKVKARDARVAELEQSVAELKSLLQTMLQKSNKGAQ